MSGKSGSQLSLLDTIPLDKSIRKSKHYAPKGFKIHPLADLRQIAIQTGRSGNIPSDSLVVLKMMTLNVPSYLIKVNGHYCSRMAGISGLKGLIAEQIVHEACDDMSDIFYLTGGVLNNLTFSRPVQDDDGFELVEFSCDSCFFVPGSNDDSSRRYEGNSMGSTIAEFCGEKLASVNITKEEAVKYSRRASDRIISKSKAKLSSKSIEQVATAEKFVKELKRGDKVKWLRDELMEERKSVVDVTWSISKKSVPISEVSKNKNIRDFDEIASILPLFRDFAKGVGYTHQSVKSADTEAALNRLKTSGDFVVENKDQIIDGLKTAAKVTGTVVSTASKLAA